MSLLPHRTAAKTYSLTVFTGSTATLLRAGGAQMPASFLSEDVICTAELDKASYKLVARSPLLHSHILHTVGEKMSGIVAADLARELAQTGRITKDSIVLKVAANQAPHWVQQAIQTQGPALRLWKKTRLANGVQGIKCVFDLATAGLGVASAAASFGATSIPAVFAAWTALAETANFLARSWQDVQRAESVMLTELARVYGVYARYKAGQKTPGGGVASIAGTSSTRSRLGAHVRSLADSVTQTTHLDTISGAYGVSFGPSVARLRTSITVYEGKLAHLMAEANKLTTIVMDLLDMDEQLAKSKLAGDHAKLVRQEDLIRRVIGDGTGAIGVSRKRSFFRKPVSILWLQAYFEVGKETAIKVRREVVDLLEHTPLNQLEAQRRLVDLLVSIGKWLGGQHEALASGSLSGFADAVFQDDNAVSTQKIYEVYTTIDSWRSQAMDVANAMRRKFPKETTSDLVKDCKVDYAGSAMDVAGGAYGVYGSVQENVAPGLPSLNPASYVDAAIAKAS